MDRIPISTLRAQHSLIRRVLTVQLGNEGRADMVMLAMRLQAYSGQCFASARYLGRKTGSSEKRWDRTLARLRELGLVRTTRRKRANGHLGTNIIDLLGLWRWLVAVLGKLLEDGRARILSFAVGDGYLKFGVKRNGVYDEVLVWIPGYGPPRGPGQAFLQG